MNTHTSRATFRGPWIVGTHDARAIHSVKPSAAHDRMLYRTASRSVKVAMSSEVRRLELDQLRKGYPCLMPESGARLACAGAVCLEERKHNRGVTLAVSGDFEASFRLGWPRTSPRLRSEWSDPQEATEDGACGVAILLVDVLTEYHIVQRSWKLTGFDYWLGPKKRALLCYKKPRGLRFQEFVRAQRMPLTSGSKRGLRRPSSQTT